MASGNGAPSQHGGGRGGPVKLGSRPRASNFQGYSAASIPVKKQRPYAAGTSLDGCGQTTMNLARKKYGSSTIGSTFKSANTAANQGAGRNRTVEWLFMHDDPKFANILQQHVRDAEEACVRVLEELDFDYCLIRTSAHNRRNKHDATGAIQTITWTDTGYTENETEASDWHLTVYIGNHRDQLLLQGHVFVYWAGTPGHPATRFYYDDQPELHRQFLPKVSWEFWLTDDAYVVS